LLDRPQRADFFVDADQVLAELLETMEFGDLLLRLAKRGRIGKGLCHRLSSHSASETELGIMAGIVRFGAMAGRFTATPDNGCYRTGPKISQAQELVQELGSVSLKDRKSINHKVPF
jgi:hypothetical protein